MLSIGGIGKQRSRMGAMKPSSVGLSEHKHPEARTMDDHQGPLPSDAPPPKPLPAFGYGTLMGLADAVPGVSGGTMALICGFYEQLIAAVHAILSFLRHPLRPEHQRAALATLRFLVPLGIGVLCTLFLATRLLVGADAPHASDYSDATAAEIAAVLAHPPGGWLVQPALAPWIYALFFGLVAASIGDPLRARRGRSRWDILLFMLGLLAAAALSLSPPGAGSTAPLALFASGAAAITVMLLPGISGSLLLLVLGMYQPVSAAVHSRDIASILWFGSGIALGIVAAIPSLRWLLARHHDRTMPVLAGLMAGSLVALWPWKEHYCAGMIPVAGPMHPLPPASPIWGPLLMAGIGALAIFALHRLARNRTTL